MQPYTQILVSVTWLTTVAGLLAYPLSGVRLPEKISGMKQPDVSESKSDVRNYSSGSARDLHPVPYCPEPYSGTTIAIIYMYRLYDIAVSVSTR